MEKDARIGLFICRCGGKIDSVIDVQKLEKEAKSLPQVSSIHIMNYPCSKKGREDIKRIISEEKLNRIVIAGCTPRTHQKLFVSICREAGIGGTAFEMANIREQCTMVHQKDKRTILDNAKAIVRMAVAKVTNILPEIKREIEISPSAVVIGAGVTGMNAALTLSKRGFPVSLVEKEKKMGGILNNLHLLYPSFNKASKIVKELIARVKAQSNINIYLNSEIKNINGHIGNYKIEIQSNGKQQILNCGSIVVATGARELEPEGLFQYDKDRIITQLQLENRLKNDKFNSKNIVMIQCVGCRNKERAYCSRICCTTAAKNALIIKKKNPDANITILFRDIPVDNLEIFLKAKQAGIDFLRYSPSKPPKTKLNKVEVDDLLSDKIQQIPYDLVVLSTPLIPQGDAADISKKLKIAVDDDGFFPQVYTMLKPEEFISNGIFLCGTAHWPSFVNESIFQAKLAASRAVYLLSKEKIELEGSVASVQEELCRGCGTCVEVCEFNAPTLIETSAGVFISNINPALCNDCGTCVSLCPTGAIIDNSFTDRQISEMLELLLTSPSK